MKFIFRKIIAKTMSYFMMRWWWCLLGTRKTHRPRFFNSTKLTETTKQGWTDTHVTPIRHIFLILISDETIVADDW